MRRISWRRAGATLSLVVLLAVFLVPGAAASSEQASSAVPLASTIHIVRPGETLYSIAARYGVDPYALARANNIANLNRIYAGQRLVISGGYQPAPAPTQYYTVRPGDTLNRIAARFGMTVWQLMQLNRIANPDRIYVGQVLCISGSVPPAPNPPPPPPPPPCPVPPPEPIPSGNWLGDYYNSSSLGGAVVLERGDPYIDFNWGWGSPAPQVMPDYFSARWTRTFYMTGGTYRITARVDDGIRVYIDGVPVIDQWHQQALRTYQQDVIVRTGSHTFTVEYFELTGVAEVHVTSQRLY